MAAEESIRAPAIAVRLDLEETGAPIEGLSVALKQATGGLFYTLEAVVRTGADGGFRIDYDTEGDRDGLSLTINDEPYDSRYTADGGNLRPGENRDFGTVEFEEIED